MRKTNKSKGKGKKVAEVMGRVEDGDYATTVKAESIEGKVGEEVNQVKGNRTGEGEPAEEEAAVNTVLVDKMLSGGDGEYQKHCYNTGARSEESPGRRWGFSAGQRGCLYKFYIILSKRSFTSLQVLLYFRRSNISMTRPK